MTHSQSRRQVIRQAAALSVGATGLLGAANTVLAQRSSKVSQSAR